MKDKQEGKRGEKQSNKYLLGNELTGAAQCYSAGAELGREGGITPRADLCCAAVVSRTDEQKGAKRRANILIINKESEVYFNVFNIECLAPELLTGRQLCAFSISGS